MWVEGGGGSLGIKLHLEVKCLQRQWLERLLRSDLDGLNQESERGKERVVWIMLAGRVGGDCGMGRRGGRGVGGQCTRDWHVFQIR